MKKLNPARPVKNRPKPIIFLPDAGTLEALKIITSHLRSKKSYAIRRAIIESAERIQLTDSLARMDAGKVVAQ